MISLAIPANATEHTPRIEFAATVQVVSFSGGGVFSSFGYNGHSFIVVKNTSSSQITVGHMPVPAGSSVTVGTFGNRSAHLGIWYNIEGYSNIPTPSYALTTAVTVGELNTLNNAINNNDSWAVNNNCSAFAVKVWNASPSSNKISGGNPAAVVNSIKSISGSYITNPTIPSKPKSSIARHTSTSYVYDQSGATSD